MNRRVFLISAASAAGIMVPGRGCAAIRPCPPPSLGVSGSTTASTVCSRTGPGQLPWLLVTSRDQDGAQAWTFGQPFRRGDVPAGSHVAAVGDSMQVDVRSRWPDGSVKFVLLSGITNLARNPTIPIALAVVSGDGAPAAPGVPEPASLDVSNAFTGSVTGTCGVGDALGIDEENRGSRVGAGRVRKIPGAIMCEFHCHVPTSDAHVAVWFYLRRRADGATEVEAVVENGWLLTTVCRVRARSTLCSRRHRTKTPLSRTAIQPGPLCRAEDRPVAGAHRTPAGASGIRFVDSCGNQVGWLFCVGDAGLQPMKREPASMTFGVRWVGRPRGGIRHSVNEAGLHAVTPGNRSAQARRTSTSHLDPATIAPMQCKIAGPANRSG
jgi:hypothetical protein